MASAEIQLLVVIISGVTFFTIRRKSFSLFSLTSKNRFCYGEEIHWSWNNKL